ncbi:MAG TPA: DUF5658 family protein [Planctomycetota bacterium]
MSEPEAAAAPDPAPDGAARPYRGPDRRQQPTPFLSRYSFFGGRRQSGRRGGEADSVFVDIYSFRAWVVLSLFLLLNLLDAHFTLLYLQRGGEEANPVAVMLLEWGPSVFILVKAIGVGVGAVLFCILKNFPNARLGVFLVMVFYQLLLAYHMYLFFFSPLE